MRQPDIIRTEFASLIQLLADSGVEFIIVGGVAAVAHSAARLTLDLDVVYRRSQENLQRLADALGPWRPYPRGPGVPLGLPFIWDVKTIQRGLNFTLRTTLGDIDLLGEIAGGGSYDDLMPHTGSTQVFGVECLCLDLPTLIQTKRSAGRPKDFEAIAELEVILEEQKRLES